MVVSPCGIVFPDSCRIFDSRNLGDVGHNVNVPEVDYMSQVVMCRLWLGLKALALAWL